MFLKAFLRNWNIDCVLDVGANLGQYALELRRIGYRGRIISFEPDPRVYEQLARRSAADPAWDALHVALGSRTGKAEFHTMNVALFNSFREPSTDETARFAGANEIAETIEVNVSRLDELLPALKEKFGFKNVFLKMDTQGFDEEVFLGSKGVHEDIRGLQSEIGFKRLYQGTKPWHEQLAVFEQHGFALEGLFAVNPGEGEIIEFDCYFSARC